MTTKKMVYRVFGPFGGGGFGLRGFNQAVVTLLGRTARFEVIGGIDCDADACVDFELMTGVPQWHALVEEIAAAEIRRRWPLRPDCVFMSPPCKGSSKLISNAKSQTKKYREMNRLAHVWTAKMLEAWADDLPPLVLFENVPSIVSRAPETVAAVERLLRAAGYVTHKGFHDCGELGGLAQHRKRFLMVARLPKKVPALLYQPPKKRVRGCGEVLGELPMPEDLERGGPMHAMPRISVVNWVRLALIPAGGDWRDLPGVLADGQRRRAKFRRHHLQPWEKPSSTIGGSGSNGPCAVADPRVEVSRQRFDHSLRITGWGDAAPTVTSSPSPSSGAVAVADPRIDSVIGLPDNPNRHYAQYTVRGWDQPAKTVIGASRPGSGAQAIADPRSEQWFRGVLGVTDWNEPAGVVTSSSRPGNGRFSVADPRIGAGQRFPDAVGAISIADTRLDDVRAKAERLGCAPRAGAYGVLDPGEPSKTVTGSHQIDNARAAVADTRVEQIIALLGAGDPKKAPKSPIVIVAADGTWHRPLTTLELAALQSIPTTVNGRPLVLAGSGATKWRETIGNAVPTSAGQAIAEQMLVCLVCADAQAFALSSGAVWVDAPDALEPGWVQLDA